MKFKVIFWLPISILSTKKLTWITDCPKTTFEVTLVELDHLITKKKVEENESV